MKFTEFVIFCNCIALGIKRMSYPCVLFSSHINIHLNKFEFSRTILCICFNSHISKIRKIKLNCVILNIVKIRNLARSQSELS